MALPCIGRERTIALPTMRFLRREIPHSVTLLRDRRVSHSIQAAHLFGFCSFSPMPIICSLLNPPAISAIYLRTSCPLIPLLFFQKPLTSAPLFFNLARMRLCAPILILAHGGRLLRNRFVVLAFNHLFLTKDKRRRVVDVSLCGERAHKSHISTPLT